MSRFLLSVSEEEANCRPNAVEVEGKEGKLYTESSNFYDKYLSRHEQVHCMSYIQFAQRYKVSKKKDLGEIDWQNEFYGYLGSDVLCADDDIVVADVDDPDAIVGNDGDDPDDIVVSDGDDPDNDDDMYVGHKMSKRGLKVTSQIKDDDFIVEYSPSETGRKMLPRFIPIIASNGVSYMQLSSKRVVRFHKFSQNKSPHEFYFSELQKYVPFKKEEEFFPKDIEACKTFYEQNLNLINFYKGKVLPHFDGVSAGRAKGEKLASDIGDILDANRAQEDDAALEEGEHQNPAMAVLEPTLDQLLNSDPPTKSTKGAYRQIDVQDEASLSAKIRTLDPEQRFVVDKVMDFARRLRRAENQPGKNERPTPPHLLVLGNGGTGKSHVIDVLSQLLQKTLSKSGDNPDHPYIVRVAFTGNASLLIKGQTLNSVFNLPFSNDMQSLSDKTRDMRRTTLQNLLFIILDEISLVKSDMLYQVHFRLSREIKQINLAFGNVTTLCFGDILQIKPASGTHVFDPPKGEKNYMEYLFSPLWQKLSPIILKTNHRQGDDKVYADICNRLRVGTLTDSDIATLNSRVLPKNFPNLPEDSIFTSGTNAIVSNYNHKKLNELTTLGKSFKAKVFSKTQKELTTKLPLDGGGMVKNSGLPWDVTLKIGARVSMTSNIDVIDGLVNGTMGVVVGFEMHANGKDVRFVMVKFNNPEHGKERRKKYNFESKYPGATAVEFYETEVSLRRKATATCTVINIPLRLAWGLTLHKIQGHTIEKPTALIIALDCWLQPGMVYVGLSRVKSLDQLYILEKFPVPKAVPWPDALVEMKRLEVLDLSLPIQIPLNQFEIVSLNVISLPSHFEDIKVDPNLMSAKVLLLQETSLTNNLGDNHRFNLEGKMCHFNSSGHRKGLATYFTPDFSVLLDKTHGRFQMTSISNGELIITNVYRSKDAGRDFLQSLESFIQDKSKVHIFMGDWNFCQRDEALHKVKVFLEKNGFISGFTTPQATHIQGRCLDQIFVRFPGDPLDFESSVKVCIYSDHEPISMKILMGD
jgi:hypothetical protein